MVRQHQDDSWDDDRWQTEEDDDLPDGVYSEDEDEGEPTTPCPHCRRHILEDSVYCPHCENYLSEEDAPPAPKPWWFVLGVILCLGIALLWAIGG
jgi:hypothetical protein